MGGGLLHKDSQEHTADGLPLPTPITHNCPPPSPVLGVCVDLFWRRWALCDSLGARGLWGDAHSQGCEQRGLEQSGQSPRESRGSGSRPLTDPLHSFVEGLCVGVWVEVATALHRDTLLFNLQEKPRLPRAGTWGRQRPLQPAQQGEHQLDPCRPAAEPPSVLALPIHPG